MTVELLTEHHFEFLSLKGGCTGLSESTFVKGYIVGSHMSRFNCVLVVWLSMFYVYSLQLWPVTVACLSKTHLFSVPSQLSMKTVNNLVAMFHSYSMYLYIFEI